MHLKTRLLVLSSLAICVAVPAFASTPAPTASRAPTSEVERHAPAQPAKALPQVTFDCQTYGNPCSAGDFDGSTTLGAGDIGVWLHNFFSGPPYNPIYDLSHDGDVTASDLAAWLCLYFNC